MNDLELLQSELAKTPSPEKGIYWSMAQNGKVLFKYERNKAVGNLYFLIAQLISCSAGTQALNGDVSVAATPELASVSTATAAGAINMAIQTTNGLNGVTAFPSIMVGTDTTTPTTASLGTLVTPVYPVIGTSTLQTAATVQSPTTLLTNTSTGIVVYYTFPSNTFGGSGSTVIGELGLGFMGYSSGAAADVVYILLSRIAVADGANLGAGAGQTVTVSNTAPVTVVVSIFL